MKRYCGGPCKCFSALQLQLQANYKAILKWLAFYPLALPGVYCWRPLSSGTHYRGSGILLAESRKSTKKSRKTGKNTENLAGNWKMSFCSHRKLKRSVERRKKHIFSAESQKQTPYSRPSLQY